MRKTNGFNYPTKPSGRCKAYRSIVAVSCKNIWRVDARNEQDSNELRVRKQHVRVRVRNKAVQFQYRPRLKIVLMAHDCRKAIGFSSSRVTNLFQRKNRLRITHK